MSKFDNTDAKQVLVFNPQKRLVAIFHSALAAAKTLGVHTQSVHYACTGRCIAVGKLYLRHLSEDIEITFDDLGELRLEDYDELCGVKRKVYPNSKMERKGMKYKNKLTN
ncbi:hypothetical protein [Bacteroides sp. 224]|uniref:hypothetical protein n=1 Tax=Bacteroides sp. 224 TaxID=2302936 RepID=UPI0013D870C2|nr:hypothetical protein [Bacteroides sp. 224]NDV63961.1 hypothetical protein [Bacteroides sp. 224]